MLNEMFNKQTKITIKPQIVREFCGLKLYVACCTAWPIVIFLFYMSPWFATFSIFWFKIVKKIHIHIAHKCIAK